MIAIPSERCLKLNFGDLFAVMSLTLEGGSQSSDGLETLAVHDSNLLITNDLDHLAHFSQELQLTAEMDTTGSESDLLEGQEMVEPELGAHEIEIETERAHSPEEILPDVKIKSSVPPLRPLTIAPKPAKVPITLKSGGQQLLLVQGNAPGQPIKLVSSQGQGITLANLSMGKPVTIRPAGKNVGNMSVLQPKQVVMKKISPVQKVADKIEIPVKSTQSSIVLPSPAKTITLAQAQQIGLLTGAKLVPQVTSKQTVVVNKSQNKAIKLIPQIKGHTKILPAPQSSTANKIGQRIILKQSNANSIINTMSSGQIIQVAGGQPLIAGQLHQINIPGKGVQYIKIVTPTTNSEGNISTTAVSGITSRQPLQVSAVEAKVFTTVTNATIKSANVSTTPNIAPKPIKTATIARSNAVHLPTSGQLVMLPANYISQPITSNAKVAIPAKLTSVAKPAAASDSNSTMVDNLESNGMRPRKPCNCTKSQCLKLYCDCFANGEFCYMCNCMNCYNNLDNEEHRQRAIKSCLERNPNAFRPKIGKAKDTGDTAVRKHTKGCNCKRSGCLKNYCECYEAKISCSSNCKCLGCRNVEENIDKKSLLRILPQTNMNMPMPVSPPLSAKLSPRNILTFRPKRHSNNKHAFSFITDDVIEATSQCLLAISDSAESNAQDEEITKRQIIEEFGRCLKEIIDCSANRNLNAVN